jgi:hypothetical protein
MQGNPAAGIATAAMGATSMGAATMGGATAAMGATSMGAATMGGATAGATTMGAATMGAATMTANPAMAGLGTGGAAAPPAQQMQQSIYAQNGVASPAGSASAGGPLPACGYGSYGSYGSTMQFNGAPAQGLGGAVSPQPGMGMPAAPGSPCIYSELMDQAWNEYTYRCTYMC